MVEIKNQLKLWKCLHNLASTLQNSTAMKHPLVLVILEVAKKLRNEL